MINPLKRMKLFYKFLIVSLFLAVGPLLLVGWRLININRLSLQDVILELHTNQAVSISENIENYMENLKEKLKFVIAAHGEPPINWTLSRRILRSMIASGREILTVSTVSSEGRELTKVYHPSLEGKVRLKDRSGDKTFVKSMETGNFAVSGLYYVENIPRINLVYPFTEDLFFYIEASLKKLLENIQNTTIGKTGFAYIVNKEGKIVMHPDINKALSLMSVSDRPIVKEVLSRNLVGSKEYVTDDGKVVIGAYAPVAALGWGIIIQQDKEEAYLSVRKMRQDAFVLLIGVVFAAALVGYFMTRNLTAPLLKVTKAARNIAGGSFNVDIISDWLKKVKSKDEITELANTFIIMTQQLKRYTDMQADQMNAILFSIADGIIMTDYSGNIILTNRRAKELLKIEPSQSLIGEKIQKIIESEEISMSLKEAREKKENIVREISLSDAGINKFLRMDTSRVSHSESGAELGTVTVIRDITLEKEIDQLKEDFMHSITHDLRSPMTSIKGFLEFLLDGTAGELNEQQREFLEIIDNSSTRLLDMINDILDVAKMESGTLPLDFTEFRIIDVVQSVIRSLTVQAQKDKVGLEIFESSSRNKNMEGKERAFQGIVSYSKISVDIVGNVRADENLIHRVLTNLVSNALKFTPKGGKIKVVLEDMGDRVQLAVADTGEGMPPEYMDIIFNKFEQVKGSRGKRKGTGLGLTITKYIVEAHGGKIWAESKLGEGSTFTFWIPRNIEKEKTSKVSKKEVT